MMFVKQPFALACVVAAAALSASAQTPELNPTVKVLARPQSPVPIECATDQSTVPALEAEAPAPEPAIASVPPSNNLRASMRRLQVAAEGDDHAAFTSAYAEAKRAIAQHPAGGERNAANDAMQVFADLSRVWDYVMSSPTGSFFDSTVQGGSLLNAMKRYPSYSQAIADETYTSGGRMLYPTRETRHFLARESARRLARLGVSTLTRVARGEQPAPVPRRVVPPPPPVTKPTQVTAKPARTKTTPKTTQAAVAKKPSVTKPKPAVKTATAVPPKTPTIKSTPVPKPKPAAPPPVKIAQTTTVAPVPPIVTATTAPPPTVHQTPPVTTTTTPATTTTAVSATDTTVSAMTSSTTDTSVTAVPDTATTATTVPAEKQNGNMNLILAVVLILVGIGVLVILFRASD